MKVLSVHAFDGLQKIMIDREPKELLKEIKEFKKGSMLKNEKYSFALALMQSAEHIQKGTYEVSVKSPLKDYITLMSVGHVPVRFTTYSTADDYYIQKNPGLFPDTLTKIEDKVHIWPFGTYSMQVLIDPNGMAKAGVYPITIGFKDCDLDFYEEITVEMEIIDADLPEQELIYTCWFHGDCVAQAHNTEVFSEKHWELLRKYIKMSADYGSNMILTPVFTPPLDTMEGGERLTIQLVDIEKKGDTYTFGFNKLRRWIEMCIDCGMKYIEVSHLFTQWGARHAPKIMAVESGEYTRIFGWETEATSIEYKSFLNQFLNEIDKFFTLNDYKDIVYFHISDEPHTEHLESYKAASEIIRENLSDYNIMDALSDVEFYKNGLVKQPIPASNCFERFVETGFDNRWTYYCCGQFYKVSNRFISMPLARCRIIGIQMYYYDVVGFLQWGYNFYNSRYSLCQVDPYKSPDSDGGFPAGDAFMVYPTKDGCTQSLRLLAFNEALQDQRALKLLEKYYGKEFAMDLIKNTYDKKITFEEYPHGSEYIINLREEINELIKEKVQK